MQKPKYSIVIPTCDRASLLEYTIKGCLLQNYDNYELLVSDNYSKDNTKVILGSFKKDPKIRVVETKSRLAMPNHWEFAMSHALGEYIIILGDDDGVSPNLLMILDEIIDTSGANIIKWQSCLYHHPDWPGPEANTLRINKLFSNNVDKISPELVIKDYANIRFKYFPNLLQTCISKDLYKRAKEKAGKVFVGAPDYSCPALLLMSPSAKYAYIDSVLGMGGRSKFSNAAYYFSQDKSRFKRSKDFYSEFGDSDILPHHKLKIFSSTNVIMASLSYALHYYPNNRIENLINWTELCRRTHQEIIKHKGKNSLFNDLQLKDFYKFVQSMPKRQRKVIYNQIDHKSFNDKISSIVKMIFNYSKSIIRTLPNSFQTILKSIIRNPDPVVFLDVSEYGCHNGEEVIAKLDYLVALGDSNYDANSRIKNHNTKGLEKIEKIGEIKNDSDGFLTFFPK